MNKKLLCALDVGSSKVCAIMAHTTADNTFQVVGVGVTPSRGLRKGIVINLDEAREVVREAVKKAEQASGLKMESAYVAIAGSHITSQNARSAIAITRNDRLVQDDDLKRVLDSARTLPTPKEREMLHIIPRDYILDGHEGIKNPVGMHGFRLDADAHVVTASASSVHNLVSCIRGAGVEVEDVVLAPLASGEAVLRPDEKEAGVLLMDIGSGTTDIAVFRESKVWHTTILPVGGYQLTRDIAIGLGIPFDLAEKLKVTYGSLSSSNGKGMAPETPLCVEDGHPVLYQDLTDILRSRMEELLGLALVELPPDEMASLIPAGVVLTGGSSQLSGLDSLVRDMFHTGARVGSPQRVHGLADALHNPAYATGVGLLIWGTLGEDAIEAKSSGTRTAYRWFKRIQHRLYKE